MPHTVNPYTVELPGRVMTNYDHTIDPVAADLLKQEEVFARYPGWDFNGLVWWDRTAETYRCEVWQWGSPVGLVSGTLEEIMTNVSASYGED